MSISFIETIFFVNSAFITIIVSLFLKRKADAVIKTKVLFMQQFRSIIFDTCVLESYV